MAGRLYRIVNIIESSLFFQIKCSVHVSLQNMTKNKYQFRIFSVLVGDRADIDL